MVDNENKADDRTYYNPEIGQKCTNFFSFIDQFLDKVLNIDEHHSSIPTPSEPEVSEKDDNYLELRPERSKEAYYCPPTQEPTVFSWKDIIGEGLWLDKVAKLAA